MRNHCDFARIEVSRLTLIGAENNVQKRHILGLPNAMCGSSTWPMQHQALGELIALSSYFGDGELGGAVAIQVCLRHTRTGAGVWILRPQRGIGGKKIVSGDNGPAFFSSVTIEAFNHASACESGAGA